MITKINEFKNIFESNNDSSLLDVIADQEHEQWSHWMKYMFSCGTTNDDGSWTMPKDKVERWKRQMETPYTSLTDKEKMSDKEMAEKPITALKNHILSLLQQFNVATDVISAIEKL